MCYEHEVKRDSLLRTFVDNVGSFNYGIWYKCWYMAGLVVATLVVT